MKRTQSTDAPEFLKHRFPLSEDRIAKLVLPVNLTRKEVQRISDFLDALVLESLDSESEWPFEDDDDPDEFNRLTDDIDQDSYVDHDDEIDEEDLESIEITEADLESAEPASVLSPGAYAAPPAGDPKWIPTQAN